MAPETDAARLAAEIRRAFDASFAAPFAGGPMRVAEAFVTIRLGEGGFAIRREQLAGIRAGVTIRRLPGPPAFLGIAGVEARVVSVLDLGALVQGRPADDEAASTWLALSRVESGVAFAFDAFGRFVDTGTERATIRSAAATSGTPRHASSVLSVEDGESYWVLDLDAIHRELDEGRPLAEARSAS